MDFDAIVIGSGISGGWAAKELCERGLRTLLIERGRHVTHKTDYQDFAAPWELANRGQVPEDEARRDYAVQSTCYAFNSATKQWWVRTANIRTSRRKDASSSGFAVITSVAGR